jgi:hypothetical protein
MWFTMYIGCPWYSAQYSGLYTVVFAGHVGCSIVALRWQGRTTSRVTNEVSVCYCVGSIRAYTTEYGSFIHFSSRCWMRPSRGRQGMLNRRRNVAFRTQLVCLVYCDNLIVCNLFNYTGKKILCIKAVFGFQKSRIKFHDHINDQIVTIHQTYQMDIGLSLDDFRREVERWRTRCRIIPCDKVPTTLCQRLD